MAEARLRFRPIAGFVLLADDPRETKVEGGLTVALPESGWRTYMDYMVADAGRETEYGAGDRVVLKHPNAGRSITLDGAPYRLVRASEVLAVIR